MSQALENYSPETATRFKDFPIKLTVEGVEYQATGKMGVVKATSKGGEVALEDDVIEMASKDDLRIWVNKNSQILND